MSEVHYYDNKFILQLVAHLLINIYLKFGAIFDANQKWYEIGMLLEVDITTLN